MCAQSQSGPRYWSKQASEDKERQPRKPGAPIMKLCSGRSIRARASREPLGRRTRARSALSLLDPAGNLSLASSRPGFPDPQNERSVWRDLDRLSTGVWSNAGDALQISVSVGVSGKGSVYLRALVDGQAAEPSDIELFMAGAATTSERSFTFIVPSVTAGFHLVRIQWLSGDSYTAHGRSLAVRSVPQNPKLATAQLQVCGPRQRPASSISLPASKAIGARFRGSRPEFSRRARPTCRSRSPPRCASDRRGSSHGP